jgi:hypothetical protein
MLASMLCCMPTAPTRARRRSPHRTARSMKGTPECLAAMARLLERHLVKGHSVDPAQLVIGSGELASCGHSEGGGSSRTVRCRRRH